MFCPSGQNAVLLGAIEKVIEMITMPTSSSCDLWKDQYLFMVQLKVTVARAQALLAFLENGLRPQWEIERK